jgi:hypothetical protein
MPVATHVSHPPAVNVFWMSPAAANARPVLFATHSLVFVFQILIAVVAHQTSSVIH